MSPLALCWGILGIAGWLMSIWAHVRIEAVEKCLAALIAVLEGK